MPRLPGGKTGWRRRVGEKGIRKLFQQILETAKRENHLKHSDLNHVNVDTTVQEKEIAFPTDARLSHPEGIPLG